MRKIANDKKKSNNFGNLSVNIAVLAGILIIGATLAGKITTLQKKNIEIQAAKSPVINVPTRTPTPACNGLCIPNGEACYKLGSGNCQKYFICCKIINSPTPAI